jgi:hypothetical protein
MLLNKGGIMDKKFLGICILIASIILSGVIFYTSKSDRYKVVGNRVFDTIEGDFVQQKNIAQQATTTYQSYAKEDIKEKPIGDISKVVVEGHSFTNNTFTHKITCVVKNNDDYEHNVIVKVIYYDKDKTPILTNKKDIGTIFSGDVESYVIENINNVENIESYKLSIVESMARDWGSIIEQMN